ncbi:MAG: sugar ABC transporter permease, partial [Actinomycetota bacterium]|nr:sugar ABC transporter permease [Actinomycetota bacterium]
MTIKLLNAVIAIIGGIGGSMILFWLLNKLAESLKGKWEDRVKPWMFAGPAILAIAVFLIYPAISTIQYSFANEDSTAYVGFKNYANLLTDPTFLQVL